jgi:hypothetical protein
MPSSFTLENEKQKRGTYIKARNRIVNYSVHLSHMKSLVQTCFTGLQISCTFLLFLPCSSPAQLDVQRLRLAASLTCPVLPPRVHMLITFSNIQQADSRRHILLRNRIPGPISELLSWEEHYCSLRVMLSRRWTLSGSFLRVVMPGVSEEHIASTFRVEGETRKQQAGRSVDNLLQKGALTARSASGLLGPVSCLSLRP